MNKSLKKFSIEHYKIQAAILLKSLRKTRSEKIAKRFKRLPVFSKLTTIEILHSQIKLKHALQLIAIENGFNSWLELKIQINFIVGGYLNLWFANYPEAKKQLNEGGFLLPYKKQFFICDANYIKQIGFDLDDPDWKKINYDWAQPSNNEAWERLYKKWSNSKIKFKGNSHE